MVLFRVNIFLYLLKCSGFQWVKVHYKPILIFVFLVGSATL